MSANIRGFLMVLAMLADVVGAVYSFTVGNALTGFLFTGAFVAFLFAAFSGRKGGQA